MAAEFSVSWVEPIIVKRRQGQTPEMLITTVSFQYLSIESSLDPHPFSGTLSLKGQSREMDQALVGPVKCQGWYLNFYGARMI